MVQIESVPRAQIEAAYFRSPSAANPQLINLITHMIKTTSLVVLLGVVEVLKVGQQIIDANRFTAPDAALRVYSLVFLLYFFALVGH